MENKRSVVPIAFRTLEKSVSEKFHNAQRENWRRDEHLRI